jgi:hypothetical protein
MHERVNNLANSISDNEDNHCEEEDDVVTSRTTLEIKKKGLSTRLYCRVK